MINTHASPSESRTPDFSASVSPIARLFLVCAAVMSLYAVVVLWHFAGYGFDFTDEAFYLFWIADPNAYRINIPVSFFGFVYRPFYILFDGDTAALRRLNIALIFGLAWALCFVVLNRFWLAGNKDNLLGFVFSAAIASSSLAYFSIGLVTPSYNALAFQSLMLTFIGLILARPDTSIGSLFGWALISLGGSLTFLAKPSSAALLALAVPIYLATSRKFNLLLILAAGSASGLTLLMFALWTDGSVTAFAERISESISLLHVLGSGQEFSKIIRLDQISLNLYGKIIWGVMLVAAIVGGVVYTRYPQYVFALNTSLCIFLIAALASVAWRNFPPIPYRGVALLAVPIACTIFSALLLRGSFFQRERPYLPLALLFLAAPHILAFGSNGNYWENGSAAALFWILSGIALLTPVVQNKITAQNFVPLALAIQLLSVGFVGLSIHVPYRQEPPLVDYSAAWNIRGKGQVKLSQHSINYLAEVHRVIGEVGLPPHRNMIDLTGRSPGVLYDIGARSLGQPWLVGDYPGSNELAVATLQLESCDVLTSAWLLVEPHGLRRLEHDTVLRSFNAALETDYESAGFFETASWAGGIRETFRQYLFRPIRDPQVARTACEQRRQFEQTSQQHGKLQ